jgi:hypothetical protein
MCKHNDMKHFRTITGEARRMAMRAHLAAAHGVTFGQSHEDMTQAQRGALESMAKAVSWRKGIACRLTLAAAFYVYLSRDVKPAGHVAASAKPATVRRPFLFGSKAHA